MPKMNTALADAMSDFESRKAFGQIQLDYQHGEVVIVRKQETVKINQRENNREESSYRR
jgi:hypothetical protein